MALVEKDVEYELKNLILNCCNNQLISITNEFRSDGIVRNNEKAVAILEFKIKRDFSKENTIAQVLCQALCYYCKLLQKEEINQDKPFYLLIGDENEIAVFNLHKMPNNWLLNSKWIEIAPSTACKDIELMSIASSMINLVKPIYYKYEDIKELNFGLYLLFGDVL